MEAGTNQRNRAEVTGSPRTTVWKTGEAHRNARRIGMRSYRREVSGNADGVVRTNHRRPAQPQRTRADFDGTELLEISEGGAGEDLREPRIQVHRTADPAISSVKSQFNDS